MGFANKPEVTEFRRGMTITDGHRTLYVIHVTPDGDAQLANTQEIALKGQMNMMTLDLDGVWEGQVRRNDEDDRIETGSLNNDCSVVHYYDAVKRGLRSKLSSEIVILYPTVVWPEKPKPPVKVGDEVRVVDGELHYTAYGVVDSIDDEHLYVRPFTQGNAVSFLRNRVTITKLVPESDELQGDS